MYGNDHGQRWPRPVSKVRALYRNISPGGLEGVWQKREAEWQDQGAEKENAEDYESWQGNSMLYGC